MDIMYKLAWIAGLAGVLLCVSSVVFRLGGAFWVGGFQTGTLMLAGIATMVFGCLCFLVVLTHRVR